MPTTYENDSNTKFHHKWIKQNNNYSNKKPKEVDHFFLLIMSIIIFFMQCGFAFMEAGAVRYVSHCINVFCVNCLDSVHFHLKCRTFKIRYLDID